MAQALLVTTERQVVGTLTQAFDQLQLDMRIIVIAQFDGYSESRLVLSSPVYDLQGSLSNYVELGLLLRKLDLVDEVPTPLVLRMNDPVVLALQQYPGPLEDPRGLNIGYQSLGDRYLEDGYVFRIRP